MEYHHGNPAEKIEKPLKSKNLDHLISDWDAKFIDLNQETLYELILAADFLGIKSLLELSSVKVASMLRGKPMEEIAGILNITDYGVEMLGTEKLFTTWRRLSAWIQE